MHGKVISETHSRKVEVYLKQACFKPNCLISKVRVIFGLFHLSGTSLERIHRAVIESESSELNSARENLRSVSLAFL